ncbi:sulfatase family protein [Gilvimarinus chinensis]|uniref:sulfatase family protein n=1 Tax=Gilvimarinus chinensis TaxID=396005 RepID=UPI000373C629|nr:sulfatase-like hydrolase/transferase [Gilvimarinus chinensis]
MLRNRYTSLFNACLLLLLPLTVVAAEQPNILVILADDLGYGDLGYTGSKEIRTPTIDELAAGGVVLTNGYVTHNYCGPSRAGLLTGRYQARFGMENNIAYSPFDPHAGIPESEQTFAKRLQEVGYTTGIIGKWHLGAAPNHHPNNRGFDYFFGFLSGGHSYFPQDETVMAPLFVESGQPDYMVNEGGYLPLVRNEKGAEHTEYLTTQMSRDAARFVRETDDPFMLYLSYNAPHAPLQAPQELIDQYQHIEDSERRVYAAMVDSMDSGIGMVLDALKDSGKYENTLIFFLSDNGGVYPESWMPNADWANNSPYRRGKVSLLEGGVHVPFVVHWAGKLPAGESFDGLVSALDIAATSVALAGADATDGKLEGVNLVPFLTGEKEGSPHPALFWRMEEADHLWAVRTEDYKYMNQPLPGVGKSFFDMKNDPTEQNNLYGNMPEQQKELADLWNQWNSQNINNIQLQAYPYQQRRKAFYDELYEERLKASKNRETYKAE